MLLNSLSLGPTNSCVSVYYSSLPSYVVICIYAYHICAIFMISLYEMYLQNSVTNILPVICPACDSHSVRPHIVVHIPVGVLGKTDT